MVWAWGQNSEPLIHLIQKFMKENIEPLRSSMQILQINFGNHIDQDSGQYYVIIYVLGVYMCEENVGLVMEAQFGIDRHKAINDLAKLQSFQVALDNSSVNSLKRVFQEAGISEDWFLILSYYPFVVVWVWGTGNASLQVSTACVSVIP